MPNSRFLKLWIASALLLSGCSKGTDLQQDPLALELELEGEWAEPTWTAENPPATVILASRTEESPYWGFSEITDLIALPAVEAMSPPIEIAEEVQDSELVEFPPIELEFESIEPVEPLGCLLAPVALPAEPQAIDAPASENVATTTETSPAETSQASPVENESESPTLATESVGEKGGAILAPPIDNLSIEERQILQTIERDQLAVSTGALTDSRLDQQAREKISSAYVLAQRGAAYAARQELIEVLRVVSQAKDAREGTRTRSASLAAGLRALEEAEDFAPRGTQLEAEMALEVICDSHRTPVAREQNLAERIPAQMIDRYNRYAQLKLAVAAAGEPAGSMALYSLGKLHSQLNAQDPEGQRLVARQAVAYQQAALLAHNQNYLAAHELGVLLAESGHLHDASYLLEQVARQQPNAVAFRNLARIHEELGRPAEANLCRAHATRLTQQGRGALAQVAWVSPQEFSRSAMPNQQLTPHQQIVANHSQPTVVR